MRPVIYTVAIALCLLATGCLRSFTTVTMHRDGTAHIVDTMLMSPRFLAMMQSFADRNDGDSTPHEAKDPWSDSTIRAQGKAFGDGVNLEGSRPLEVGGMRGYEATYTAQNINWLHFDKNRANNSVGMSGSNDSPDNATMDTDESEGDDHDSMAGMDVDSDDGDGGDGDHAKADKSQPVTFTFADNVLTIHNSVPEPSPSTRRDTSAPKSKEELMASLDMMSGFMRGMKMNLRVRVDQPIKSTNAENIDGNTITLMAVDFDKLIDAWQNDITLFAAFDDIKDGDVKAMRKALARYPKGTITVELQKEIEIRF